MSIGIRRIYRKLADSIITNNDVPGDIGLSIPVIAGQFIRGYFEVYANGTGGGAFLQVAASGLLTSIAGRIFFDDVSAGVYTSVAFSALPASTGVAPAAGDCYFTGSFLAQAGADGTISILGSQAVVNAAATTFLAGSWIDVVIL